MVLHVRSPSESRPSGLSLRRFLLSSLALELFIVSRAEYHGFMVASALERLTLVMR